MSNLSRITEAIRRRRTKALVPFLTAGYPDLQTSRELLAAVARAGCEVVEIGIPFSDPVADGPVIQASSQQALAQGMTLPGVLDPARVASQEHDLAVVLMGYLNPILRFGPESFASACAESGVSGLIVPDLPLEEAGPLRGILADRDLTLVDLVAPTTGTDRLAGIAATAAGFLYLVSATGVTGAAGGKDISAYIERVRQVADLPLYVGFGVSSPEDAARICVHADGVVIGSALLRLVAEAPDSDSAVHRVSTFLREVNAALAATEENRP